jgi:hypothetical protein
VLPLFLRSNRDKQTLGLRPDKNNQSGGAHSVAKHSMTCSTLSRQIAAGSLLLLLAGGAHAAVSAEEAAKLGTTLTAIGGQPEGNAEGTIPPYTGGLPVGFAPPGYTPGDTMLPDPFAGEKPRLVITAQNMAEHADKLTAVTQELLRRYPSFRLDVYPTHRSLAIAPHNVKNALRNATGAKAIEGGLAMENAYPGVPFPIPATGNEAMWNHLFRAPGHLGYEITTRFETWNVDASGKAVLATGGDAWVSSPLGTEEKINTPAGPKDVYGRIKVRYNAPSRRAGEAILAQDSVNPMISPRKAWQYLPGQRRVKLAPDIAFDTPNPGTAGSSTYDDVGIFNGSMERFDFKLVGKKELYVPYNTFKLNYEKEPAKFLTANHIDPSYMRWELHRVWVVEATLKPGKRHIYKTRIFYLDEDSWGALASDQYDLNGGLYRGSFAHVTPNWTLQTAAGTGAIYDLISGVYNAGGIFGPFGGIKYIKPLSPVQWSPEALAGSGIR